MQDLNGAPRQALTEDQVTALLVGAAAPVYGRGLEVLDASLKVIADVSDRLQGGQVVRTMRAAVHGTCSLTVAEDFTFDYGAQLLRPYMTISDGATTAKFYCGAYRVARPATDWSASVSTGTLTGWDRLSLLARPVGDTYVVTQGTQYLAAVRQVITDAGLDPATVALDATKDDAILPADMVWPLLVGTTYGTASSAQKTFRLPADGTAVGVAETTWLDVINDLLGGINYRALWADQDGRFRAGPYQRPASRMIEFAFDFDDDTAAVVAPNRQLNVDQSNPVNKWVFQQSNLTDAAGNPLAPSEGAGQYTRLNQNYGPTSVNAQGGLVWPVVVQLNVADQATLQARGDAYVDKALAAAQSYSVAVAPFPVAGHWDAYSYSDTRAVADGPINVLCSAWTLDLGSDAGPPADMTMTWETT